MAMGRPRAFDTCEALDRAMEVFWRKGYEGASLVDLTTAMGINSPSLYAAFGSKKGLFKAVLDRYEEDRMGFLSSVISQPTAKDAAMRYLLGCADKATDPNEPPGCLLLQSGLSCGERDASIPEELARHRAVAELALRERFEYARSQGDLPKDADPVALARYLMAVSNGMCVQAGAGATREDLHNVAKIAMAAWPVAEGKHAAKKDGAKKTAKARA